MAFSLPILLMVFNRPDKTRRMIEVLRKIRPGRVFVSADGPRDSHPGDFELCRNVRRIVATIDWECHVESRYHDQNLGCKIAVSSAIDWFFEQVGEGIILEDDCLPSASFFPFCQELLERYRHDDRVMAISGTNVQGERTATSDSYYFSRYPHCWGWATWRSSWQAYDLGMMDWPAIRDNGTFLRMCGDDVRLYQHWRKIYDRVYSGEIDTWDHQWTLSCWHKGGVAALPAENLVRNIGFGDDATHTKKKSAGIERMQAKELTFPLKHPAVISRNIAADRYTDTFHYRVYGKPKESRFRRKLKRLRKAFGR